MQTDLFVGAHELILYILEPSLEKRATLRDITTHPWLQYSPRQDSDDSYVISELDKFDHAGTKLTGDDGKVSIDSSLPAWDDSWTDRCRDNCRTVSPLTVASSLCDSPSIQRDGKLYFSALGIRDRNLVEDRAGLSIVTDDFIPLCVNDCVQLSPRSVATCEDYGRTPCGSGFTNKLISSSHLSSDFSLQPTSSSTSCISVCNPLSDVSVAGVLSLDGHKASVMAAKLPRSFSADSLELANDRSGNDSVNNCCSDGSRGDIFDCDIIRVEDDGTSGDDSDNDDGEICHCGDYNFADIDAVLNQIAGDVGASSGADVDVSSQVSYDSLEDAV